ncbi:MAG: hypothetical protein N2117_11495 [Anaerolineales bacterium]|nr:hypothetical protein [Anaerolineales bacterium]MCX7755851.1 hypothetical protein [Anaerolineales bacterium]MDW8277454.1 hypothetical protein [Anaerolineales bacterium]
MNFKRNLKFAFALLALMVLMVAVYGFAASNTVGSSAAGDGAAAISGYTITNIHYNLNATNPATIDSMTFNISPAVPAGGAVHVKLISTGTTYTSCTVTGGTNVTCTFAGGVSVLNADELRVIAAQ